MTNVTIGNTALTPAPADRTFARLWLGQQPTIARVMQVEHASIDLFVPRATRLAVGDAVTLELSDVAEHLEGLQVAAVCDARRFRRATDTVKLGDGAPEAAGLWVRCVAETPKARARLWALSPNGVAEAPVLDAGTARQERDRLPARGHDGEDARRERLQHLRVRTGKALPSLEHTRLVAERLRHNIEHLVGSVEVPVGAAGPMLFRGSAARDSIYLPTATTEGALVASTTRGALALTLAGGVHTRVLSQTMHRVPAFTFATLDQACRFARWVQDHEAMLREQAEQVSRHARLVEIDPTIIGRAVHVRFVYETGDAAGQNMTTACTWHACQWVLAHIPHLPDLELDIFAVEGGMSTDKKVSFASLVRGRGMRVAAECHIDASTLRRVLKVTPEQLVRGHHAGLTAALQAGEIGYNINVANVIAAVFTATGQDIGCVHESALGILQIDHAGDGVCVSMVLPSLIIGTVGGGTQLPQQREYLEVMGCAGTGGVRRLGEVIAGYCLALDLSTLAAVASGQFATAHERLGRNRPVAWLREGDFDAALFNRVLDTARDGGATVTRVERSQANVASSIVTNLTASRNTGKFVGFLAQRLELQSAGGERTSLETLSKVKPLDEEAMTVLRTIAAVCGEDVARAARRHEPALGFQGCHARELAVYRQTDPRFTQHTPVVHGILEDPAREAYVLVLERLQGLTLMDCVDDISVITQAHREVVVDGLSSLHSIWLGRERELMDTDWIGPVPSTARMVGARDLWVALADHARQEFPEWVDQRAHARWLETIEAMVDYWPELEQLPRTLIHNDFSPRNFALRSDGDGLRLCAYDWELATVHVPQRDLAEMLAFTLDTPVQRADVLALLEQHRVKLEQRSGIALDPTLWRRGFVLGLRDLLVTRMGLYTMGHTCRDYRFLPRVFRTLMRLLDLFDDEISVRNSAPSSDAFPIP